MQKNKLRDVIQPNIKFDVMESSEVDGVHVLAKVKGQFFVPDGKSRNGRFYPSSLWEKVCADPGIKSRLKARTMFGTVGHDADLNDKGIREGLASHVMTNVFIDEKGQGIGEALIMNTPTGKILNTILRCGSQLFVSSRANGTFKGKKDDMPIVDEDNYDLDGWDFVIDPGFLEAHPTIAESLEEIHNKENENNNDNYEDGIMNEKLIKHITDENASLKNKVGDLTDEVSSLKESNETLTKENDHVTGELGKLEEANKAIEGFEVHGTAEEIKAKLEEATTNEKTLKEYRELGEDPAKLKEAVETKDAFIKKHTEEFGSAEEIETALKTSISFKESVDALGSVEEIKEALETLKNIVEEKEKEENDAVVKGLVEELGLEEAKIVELLAKYSADDVRDLYKIVKPVDEDKETPEEKKKRLEDEKIKESKNRYSKKNFDEDKETPEEKKKRLEKEADKGEFSESRVLSGSRIKRMNENYSA